MREEFAPFEETVEKRVPFRIRPSDLAAETTFLGFLPAKNPLLAEIFQGLPEPVATPDQAVCDGPQAIHTDDFATYAHLVEQAAAVAGKVVGATA